ncbi:hypothetical protein L2E82_45877 [Cichorium intybus]|uniref:Uncharacterized protein n=1 Tax=Cichorium intybus TaxID=13427 RepID=A0ACB8ZUQ9_CICIN|nr:hypothetical protein L2E82_45877 [Cichorium intybus]
MHTTPFITLSLYNFISPKKKPLITSITSIAVARKHRTTIIPLPHSTLNLRIHSSSFHLTFHTIVLGCRHMATCTSVSTHHKEDGFNKQSQNRSLMKATRIRGKLLLLDRIFRTFLVRVKSSPSKSDSSDCNSRVI